MNDHIVQKRTLNNDFGGGSLEVISSTFLSNNLFVNNSIPFAKISSISLKNCVFLNNNTASFFNQYEYLNLTLDYCLIENSGTLGENISHTNCLFEDPQLDFDYTPIWTSTQKSPLIDSGDTRIKRF